MTRPVSQAGKEGCAKSGNDHGQRIDDPRLRAAPIWGTKMNVTVAEKTVPARFIKDPTSGDYF